MYPGSTAPIWVIADLRLSALKAFAASGKSPTKSLWRSSVFSSNNYDTFTRTYNLVKLNFRSFFKSLTSKFYVTLIISIKKIMI